MRNDGTLPVLFAAGALVIYARILESGVAPSYTDRPFDPKAAAADPFGVGSVTPQEVLTALHDAIQSRLDDHPTEWANIVYADVVRNVLAYTEGETRQVQDIRKRYVLNIRKVHVQPERSLSRSAGAG
jgi:hypothetical protein